MYVKGPFELHYQLLINNREKARIKKLKNPNALIVYSHTIDDVYENLEHYNQRRKLLIVFDATVADMEANRKVSPIVTSYILRRLKTQTYTKHIFQPQNFFNRFDFFPNQVYRIVSHIQILSNVKIKLLTRLPTLKRSLQCSCQAHLNFQIRAFKIGYCSVHIKRNIRL